MRKELAVIITLTLPFTALSAESRSPFERKLLDTSRARLARLDEGHQKGLIELAPVNLPTDPKGDNDHFGWPVATKVGDTIIVVHRAMPGHNRKLSGDADQDTTYSMIVRSTDGGRSWSEPYDVRQCMTPEDRNRGGSVPLGHRYKFDPDNDSPLGYKLHLNAIGPTRDGAVVLVSNHGVFRSEDEGNTWRHLRLAFREDQHGRPDEEFVFVGPRIIDHPELGLLLFGHHTIYRNRRPHDIARELAIYRSRDGGERWEDISVTLPEWCKQAEPNAIARDGVFFVMARNQTSRYLVQLRWKPGEPIEAKDTNMLSKRSVDTSDVMFNPVTERFEVVQSNRTAMSIDLFSLAPQEWDSAKWRLEGRLFQRGGAFYSTADGFHTGGAILDLEDKVQHVFFYSGHPGGPAGVFRITRTLDTPKLVDFLGEKSNPPETRTVRWTGKGQSARWEDAGNWDSDVPGEHNVALFDNNNANEPIVIEGIAHLGRIEVRLPRKTDRLTLTGAGRLVLHGVERLPNKFSTAQIVTGILDIGAGLRVEIRHQRFNAGNRDGTIVIRSNNVRAGGAAPDTGFPTDPENLKVGINDRGKFVLATWHWQPGMSLDMSSSHTVGPKVWEFAHDEGPQGVTFSHLDAHDGDAVEILGFKADDFFRFEADPFTSTTPSARGVPRPFRIKAMRFVGWPDGGAAAVECQGSYWYLLPAGTKPPADRGEGARP